MEAQIALLKVQLDKLHYKVNNEVSDIKAQIDALETQLYGISESSPETVSIESTNTLIAIQPQIHPNKVEKALEIKDLRTPPLAISMKSRPLSVVLWQIALSFQPLAMLLAPLIVLYRYNRAQGKSTIFLFTSIGVGLLIAGFAYLAQLLVSELGAGNKTLLLLGVSIGIGAAGVKVYDKAKYRALTPILLGLSTSLSFVTIFVAGSVYELLLPWLVTVSYFTVAVTGFVLAQKYQSKIVSLISVIGGSCIPLIVMPTAASTNLYMAGLFLIVAAALLQALKEKWTWLGYVSVLLTFACIEGLSNYFTNTYMSFSAEAFYLLFTFFCFALLYPESSISKNKALLFTANIIASLGIMMQNNTPFSTLVILCVINATIFTALYIATRRKHRSLATLSMLSASVWLLTAAIAYLDAGMWGIATGIEGLLLLFIAMREKLPIIRHESHILLFTAVVLAIYSIVPYFPLPALQNNQGWMVITSVGLIILLWRKLLGNCEGLLDYEVLIRNQLFPLETLGLTIIGAASALVFLDDYSSLAIPVIQILILYRATLRSCIKSELVAYLLLVLLLNNIINSVIEVGSVRFSQQTLPGQLSVAVIAVECWLLAIYYRRFNPHGLLKSTAEAMRLGFYLALPLFYLPTTFRNHYDYIGIALWGSALISYILGRTLRNKLVRIESMVIGILAFLYTPISLFELLPTQTFIALATIVIATSFNAYFIYALNKQKQPSLESSLASAGLVTTGLIIGTIFDFAINIVAFELSVLVYFFILTNLAPRIKAAKKISRFTGNLFVVIGILSLPLTLVLDNYLQSVVLISFIALMGLCFIPTVRSNFVQSMLIGNQQQFLVYYQALLAISYTTLSVHWESPLYITPLLIAHGSILMFGSWGKIKSISKMALIYIFAGLLKLVFIDVSSTVLWQKVVMMIGIGLFMLIAATLFNRKQQGTVLPN